MLFFSFSVPRGLDSLRVTLLQIFYNDFYISQMETRDRVIQRVKCAKGKNNINCKWLVSVIGTSLSSRETACP